MRFGQWRLLLQSRHLLAGEVLVPLGNRAFDVLLALVEARGRLVTKDELLDHVWHGVVVEENNLQVQVSALRRAFGPEASTLIATISGHGYRFIGPLEFGEAEPLPPFPSNAVSAPASTAGRRDAVVVHPFTAPAALADLCAALATDVATELARFEDLRILFAAESDVVDAYHLHAEARPLAGKIRVSARVARAGETVWAGRFDRPAARPAVWLDEISASLCNRVDLEVGQASLDRARGKAPDALTARDLCLLGRELHQRGKRADTYAAQDLFARAVSLDRGSAPGWAWFAFTVMRTVTHSWVDGDDAPERVRALQLARRALELAPASPLCLCAVGFALSLSSQWDEAVGMARAALKAGRPADYGTRTSCGEVLAAGGFPGEAVAAVRRAMELDPHCPPRARAVLGRALLLQGHTEQALKELRGCTALLPDYAPPFRTMVVAFVEAGDLAEAGRALGEVARLQPNWLSNDRGGWYLRRDADVSRFQKAFGTARTSHLVTGARSPGSGDAPKQTACVLRIGRCG